MSVRRLTGLVACAAVGLIGGALAGTGCHPCAPRGPNMLGTEWSIDRMWVNGEERTGLSWGRVRIDEDTVTVSFTDGSDAEWVVRYAVTDRRVGLR